MTSASEPVDLLHRMQRNRKMAHSDELTHDQHGVEENGT